MRLFAPVTNRGEAIGVLELSLSEAPDVQTLADVSVAAHALAYVVISNRRFTDLFEWGQRSVPLSLAAEIQHRIPPGAYTCEAGQFTWAGRLEPAGNIGGDTFDFAIERDTLHLSMTDAMGHTVNASVLASVLVGALCNARRAGVGLAEEMRLADAGLAEYIREGGFVTGQIAHRLARRDRDHRQRRSPAAAASARRPCLARHSGSGPPFGSVQGASYRVQPLPLAPGDRLIFVTDGMPGAGPTALRSNRWCRRAPGCIRAKPCSG